MPIVKRERDADRKDGRMDWYKEQETGPRESEREEAGAIFGRLPKEHLLLGSVVRQSLGS